MKYLVEKFKQCYLSSLMLNIYILILIFLPKNISTIGIIPIRLVFTCILIMTFLYDIFIKKRKTRQEKGWIFIIVCVLFILSTIPSLTITKSIVTSLYTIVKFIVSFVLLYLILKIKFSKEELYRIKRTVIFSLFMICILGILQYLFKINLFTPGIEYYKGAAGRIGVTFFNTIYFGIFINLLFPIVLYFLFNASNKKQIIIYFTLSVLMYVNLLLTFTRSSFLVFIAILVLSIVLLYKKSIKIRTFVFVSVIVGLTFLLPGGNGFVQKAIDDGKIMLSNSSVLNFLPNIEKEKIDSSEDIYLDYDDKSEFQDFSLQHREVFAKIAKRIANEHIYTGVGFGSYINYMRSDSFKISHPEYTLSITHPHSSFVLIFSEVGIFGLLFFIIIFGLIFLLPFVQFVKYLKSKNIIYDLTIVLLAVTCGFIVVNIISENAVYDTQIFPIFILVYGIIYGIILDKSENDKILFISSTGGHLNELLQLKPLFKKYNSCLITEKTKSTMDLKNKYESVDYLVYGTKDHKFSYIFKLLYNCIKSLILYIKIKPKVIVTTGTHTAVPMCYIGKLFGSKIIYIETFANSKTKTISGKMIYPIADIFIVQWESMLKLYPKAICSGWIY